MLEENLQKIIELRHDAPYTVLGPHYDSQERALLIRAFLPGAERAYVVPSAGIGPREMQRLHPDGLFMVRWPGVTHLDYQLKMIDADGAITTFHDPYAIHAPSFSQADSEALCQGKLDSLYAALGAHPQSKKGITGVHFTLWAPHASRVSVVGIFNQWDGRRHFMERCEAGVWELFIPGAGVGDLYKYEIRNGEGAVFLKTDPLALQTEVYPSTAAVVRDLEHGYTWADDSWMVRLLKTPGWELPVTLHQVTFGDHPGQVASYGQLKEQILPQLSGRTGVQVELSFWTPGETVAGYFTPNPRYGRPEELMAFIDACHQHGIGVILDWIPAQIPREGQELTWFDGSRLYDVDVPGQPGMLAF
ncbi:MAG: 1,4-alpha-glucan branching enzyme, partial [Pseudomonadota bacterium]|nr:1,4-alpha-glucan branching enzyme [Pseudomonadota bacterium]